MEHQDKIDILEIRNKLLKADYEASEQENAKLKAENDRLKEQNEILKEFLNQYQEEANALKSYETYKIWLNNEYRKENERLKEELATYGATGVCEVCSDKANKLADKYFGCLQEIKEYLEDIDYIAQFDGTPYDLSVELKQIITKAESEG